jgi:hypothetical protein
MPAVPTVRIVTTERRGIIARLRSGDGIFAAVVFVIAVMLGLKVLWMDNPAWGGYEDLLIAVLWGLGLHQTSAGAFEGIAGFASKFAK